MKLFEPLKIKNLELKNRVVLPPMQVHADFRSRDGRLLYARWARGGCGTVILPFTSVDMFLSDELWKGQGSLAEFLEGCRLLTASVHSSGASVGIQLNHTKYFPSGIGMKDTRGKPVAPSSGEGHQELTLGEIEVIIGKFARAASQCQNAGFDFVEFHGAHSYLPCEFFSPLDNRRNDRYGGDLQRRMNFGLDAIKAMRAAVGNSYLIFYRLGAWGGRPGDTTLEEACKFAVELEKAGVDCLDISVAKPGASPVPGPDQPPGTYVHLAAAVKRCVSVPVIAVGRINNPDLAESILAEGKADLIAVGRQLIADPCWPQKMAAGQPDEVRPCLSCNVCLDSLWEGKGLQCSVNPFARLEADYALKPARVRKEVLVVGAGPAGMQAAAILAERGHRVTLWEKGHELGGQLVSASLPPFKGEIAALSAYLIRQLAKSGVSVSLQTEATLERIEQMKPDAVVVAAGVRYFLPQIPGINNPKVVSSSEVLAGRIKAGPVVVIIGGELVGCETADYLVDRCQKVVVMRRGQVFATKVNPLARESLLARLERKGVVLIPGVKYEEINENGLVVTREGKTETFPADTIVVAAGAAPETGLIDALKEKGIKVYAIGDCVTPGKILDALRDALRVGQEI
jgi:2,4-dienoyl-CoA reductase-like NADH-dependent reductase (Old Yellow Enzyme family)/thioredoxin reductase